MLRPQFHFRPGPNGFFAWDVANLLEASADLPVVQVPLSQIAELDENYWYLDGQGEPTPRSLAEHMKLVAAADLQFPILLCARGRVMDGMHRVTKAVLEGRTTIAGKRFKVTPPPDHEVRRIDDLPV